MQTSKTIAALLGPTLMAGALSVLLNLRAWPGLVEQAAQNPAIVLVSGFPLFVAGLAIVYFHNRWPAAWPAVVTVFGWIAIVSGLLRILFPTQLFKYGVSAVQTPGVLPIVAIVLLAVGAFLSYKAYGREQ
ncbi:MAG: hypothetical protein ACLPWS_19625 [Rhodomicrobium sp.]